jgi:6-phosphogluconolactonase
MSTAPNGQQVIVQPNADDLAALIAAGLVVAIDSALAARGQCHLALTGGGIGTASLAAVREQPACDGVDWSRVDFWWSDERFEPEGSPLRNETGARAALLDHLPLDPHQVHPMPTSDGRWGDDVDAAAAGYTAELAAAADSGTMPVFDVALLGVGPDGHVASIFPELPGLMETDGVAIPVRNSPKPPPTRISLTLSAICQARAVWLITGGEEKATALREALFPDGDVSKVSAGRVFGTEETLALLDSAAASLLPVGPDGESS